MMQINTYKPNWAVNERFAKEMIFLNVNGKLLAAKVGKELESEQKKDLTPEEAKAVNQFLISKERLKIQSTTR